jgi:hypothetical protein
MTVTEATLDRLLAHLPTTDDVSRVLLQLQDSRAALFSHRITPASARDSLPWVLQQICPVTALETQESFDHWLKEISVATLVLAYLPTTKQALELIRLLRAALGNRVVVQLKIEPDLLAGVRVEYNGKRSEYSLQQAFKELHD